MRSRIYTKEIGVNSSERPVPKAVSFVILALVAAAGLYFVRQVQGSPSGHASATPEQAAVKVTSR